MEAGGGHRQGAAACPSTHGGCASCQVSRRGSRLPKRMAVLLLGLGLFALALPACIALPAQGSEAGDGPAMRLRGAGDEAAGGGAPRFFNPETMRVTTEDETLTMGCLPDPTRMPPLASFVWCLHFRDSLRI